MLIILLILETIKSEFLFYRFSSKLIVEPIKISKTDNEFDIIFEMISFLPINS